MNKNEAIYKAKEILGQKSLSEITKEESWIVLGDGWEMNIWQDEETGEYKSAVFPVNSEGDISGVGIPICTINILWEKN